MPTQGAAAAAPCVGMAAPAPPPRVLLDPTGPPRPPGPLPADSQAALLALNRAVVAEALAVEEEEVEAEVRAGLVQAGLMGGLGNQGGGV